MEHYITEQDIQNGIERAHKLRSEMFFSAIYALIAPFSTAARHLRTLRKPAIPPLHFVKSPTETACP